MTLFRPDPTFYPSPRMAMKAPAEKLGYVATLNYGDREKPDALAVVDLDPGSGSYGKVIHTLQMPYVGDELHHYGWSCCSSDGHSRHHHPASTARLSAEMMHRISAPCTAPSVRPSRSEPQFGSMPSTTVARIYDSMRTASPAG